MGRKPKLCKQKKIEICKAYDRGEVSLQYLANKFSVGKSTVRNWYYRYKANGKYAFETLNHNNAYSKEFKDKIVTEYIKNTMSILEISAKYNISTSNIRRWINLCYNGIENTSYEPKGEAYTMKSRKTNYKERISIVKEVLASDMKYALVAEKYDINYALVYQWTQKYLRNGENALDFSKKGRKSKDYKAENLSEIELLKLELKKEKSIRERLELQVELLKKKEIMELEAYHQLDKK